jgi:hypothetical protein
VNIIRKDFRWQQKAGAEVHVPRLRIQMEWALMNEGSGQLAAHHTSTHRCLHGPRLESILSRDLMNLPTEGPMSAGSTW